MRSSLLAFVILSVSLVLSPSCSSICDRENLPNKGDASTPEHLMELVHYACINHCWSSLYDHVSARTREKYSYVEFRLGFPDLKQPGSEDKVVDLVASSELDVVSHSHLGDEFRLAYLSYHSSGETKDLNVLLIEEPGSEGKPEWHVALQEQIDKKVPFE